MRALLPLTLLLASTPAIASGNQWLEENLQIHGFAALSAVKTSDNRFFGDSDETSFDFTELGLNFSLRANPRVLISAQALARKAGDMYDGNPSLDYALIDLSIWDNLAVQSGIRLGRVKNRLGLYNETRDVPFTRPGIFLPQSVYYDKTRNLLLSSDGLALYFDHISDFGSWSFIASAGRPVIDENVEWAFLGADWNGRLKSSSPFLTTSLWYEPPVTGLKLALSYAQSSLRFYPWSEDAGIGPGETEYQYWIGSLQYDAEDFTLTGEYSLLPVREQGYNIPPIDRDNTILGWYIQGAYRPIKNVELMARYEEGYSDRADKNGERLSRLTGGATPPYDFFTKAMTAGVRWDITSHVMIRAEYQRHIGTFDLSIRENPDPTQLEKHWDLFAIQAAFRF